MPGRDLDFICRSRAPSRRSSCPFSRIGRPASSQKIRSKAASSHRPRPRDRIGPKCWSSHPGLVTPMPADVMGHGCRTTTTDQALVDKRTTSAPSRAAATARIHASRTRPHHEQHQLSVNADQEFMETPQITVGDRSVCYHHIDLLSRSPACNIGPVCVRKTQKPGSDGWNQRIRQ